MYAKFFLIKINTENVMTERLILDYANKREFMTFIYFQTFFHILRLNLKQAALQEAHTSETGLRGDLRSRTLGLLSFGVLLLAEIGDEEESGSSAAIFSGRAARGDTFLGTSGDPFLPPKHTKV